MLVTLLTVTEPAVPLSPPPPPAARLNEPPVAAPPNTSNPPLPPPPPIDCARMPFEKSPLVKICTALAALPAVTLTALLPLPIPPAPPRPRPSCLPPLMPAFATKPPLPPPPPIDCAAIPFDESPCV